MKSRISMKMLFLALSALWLLCFYAGCEKSTDGPISVSSGNEEYDGEGFFLSASLDSGKRIHLVGDTLLLSLGNIWSFSNCALQAINLDYKREDSILWIMPSVKIHVTEEDCAAPFYRPDTTIRILVRSGDVRNISQIKVKNDKDSILDSIMIRRGSIAKDTFFVYMDSAFGLPHNYPIRTNDIKKYNSKRKDTIPTLLRVLDSLTPRVFYWRTMKSTCTHRIDMCNSTIADTIYPTSWKLQDTNLVPVHYACADTDSVYCINSKWEDDSTSLGKLQERPDTIWHYSTYYIEHIPKCGTYNSFNVAYYAVGQRVRFIRELFKPDEEESFCGPATAEEWMVYNMSGSRMVVDSLSILDSLLAVWKEATVAPDTLIVDTTKSKK